MFYLPTEEHLMPSATARTASRKTDLRISPRQREIAPTQGQKSSTIHQPADRTAAVSALTNLCLK
ncbi:hypothetical protein [Planctomicrobium piriforme]|uniref:hypothetical protein n=1 Tax=Planctomicrobium piriforme TaxID=1576369 RepID=UPI000B84A1E7|nr:hypothetical protein [Planctomicrobium piriforme]